MERVMGIDPTSSAWEATLEASELEGHDNVCDVRVPEATMVVRRESA